MAPKKKRKAIFFMAPKKKRKAAAEEVGEEGEEGGQGAAVGEVGAGESGGAAGSGAKRCQALFWAGKRCRGTKAGGTNFCRSHMRGHPHGIAGDSSENKDEEPAQGKRRRRGQKLERREDLAEGAEEAVVHLPPEYEGPEFQEMDIDMFFLPLALDKVGALSIFWNTQQAPCNEGLQRKAKLPTTFPPAFSTFCSNA